MDLNEEVACWFQSIVGTTAKSQAKIHRDLSDGCFVAEVIKRYYPKLVDMHNYSKASSVKAKKDNLDHLRRKVFPKLGIKLSDEQMNNIAEGKVGGIEQLLNQVYTAVMKVEAEKRQEEELKAEQIRRENLPPPQWVPAESCSIRRLHDGSVELKYKDRVFTPKDKADERQKTMEKQLEELKMINKQLRSQTARLQITVGLKEARLEDLTNDLHELRIKYEGSQ